MEYTCLFAFTSLCLTSSAELLEIAVSKLKQGVVVRKYFYQLWLQLLADGVVDPMNNKHHECKVRKTRARGFAKCTKCECLNAKIAEAVTNEEMEVHLNELRLHHESVKQDRVEVARIARLCKSDPRHVGFMIDAVDKKKFQIPTTERDSKSLHKLKRLIQKITGVQWFHDDSIHLYQNLPDVPTGGNLTMTIMMEIFKNPRVQGATDLYVNFDGASDNICYHVFYGLAYLLYSARQTGWPLQRIHILRFKVVFIFISITLHSRALTSNNSNTHTATKLLVCFFTGRTHS